MRNVVFAFAICGMLLCPALLSFCLNHGVSLPGWLTSEDAKYLSGGTSVALLEENMSLESFREGDFQVALQTEIGNYIPLKSAVLLGNAALQRSFIAVSNELFGWSCYATYYGSEGLYVPAYDALSYIPSKEKIAWLEQAREFATELAGFAGAHPDIEFRIVIPDTLHTSRANPAMELTSRHVYLEDFVEVMEAECESAQNVIVCGKTYDSLTGYLDDFYATDGHWNGWGAVAAYNELVGAIGHDMDEYMVQTDRDLEDSALVYNGQNSRTSLMLLNEPVDEPALKTSSLSVDWGAFGYLLLNDGPQLLSDAGLYGKYNFYAIWYGGDEPTVIVSEDAEGGNALIVSDSFGDPMRWVIASGHSRTYGVMDLYGASRDDVTLDERLRTSNANTVYFVASPLDFATFVERHATYFD